MHRFGVDLDGHVTGDVQASAVILELAEDAEVPAADGGWSG
jgi:hypothetical protein